MQRALIKTSPFLFFHNFSTFHYQVIFYLTVQSLRFENTKVGGATGSATGGNSQPVADQQVRFCSQEYTNSLLSSKTRVLATLGFKNSTHAHKI